MRRPALLPVLLPLLLGWLTAAAPASVGAGGTLRIGLKRIPARSIRRRAAASSIAIVFAALCDKLIDLSPKLDFIPQLATAWAWSDGGRDADAASPPGRTLP